MYKLLELREKYKVIYSRYSMYIDAAFKFFIALFGMITINSHIGTMGVLENPLVVIIISLLCAILPKTLGAMILMLVIVGHMYAIALEVAAVILVAFIVMYLLFFRFTPKESIVLVGMPILCMMNIPYVVPVILGLVASPVSAISMAFGTLVYFILSFVGSNYNEIIKIGADDGFKVLELFTEEVLKNPALYFTIVIFAVVLILVYVLKRLSIDYSWIIAVCAGGVAQVVMFLVGNIAIDMSLMCSTLSAILGGLISVGICWFLQFFLHSVDYTRAEQVQFEDDEYYYYVKAVPKVKVSAPNVKVKRVKAKPAAAKSSSSKVAAKKTGPVAEKPVRKSAAMPMEDELASEMLRHKKETADMTLDMEKKNVTSDITMIDSDN